MKSKTAISEGIDLAVAGAGFSRDMFGLGKESGTPIKIDCFFC